MSTEHLPDGAALGQGICAADGVLLLAPGLPLNGTHRDALRRRGVASVYVRDEATEGIEPRPAVAPAARQQVFTSLRRTFEGLGPRLDALRAEAARGDLDTADPAFRRAIRQAVDGRLLADVLAGVDALLRGVPAGAVVAGLESLRSHDSYTFDHCIDVTVLGLLLARQLEWHPTRVRLFGVGLILHDIGKLFLPAELLNKQSRLTDEEFALVRRHPALGHALVRELVPSLGPLAALVAWEHHERQDGTGYPRGLLGENHLVAAGPGKIHPFGALAAVADVYDALTSDRAYRPGLPPDRALATIDADAGRHLNVQAVRMLGKVVAPFPLCTEVTVTAGRWAGYGGVVSDLNRADLARPRVRLVREPGGEAMATPVELDLLAQPDAALAGGRVAAEARSGGPAADEPAPELAAAAGPTSGSARRCA